MVQAVAIENADAYQFKLEMFEGPLDLLLHLVRINEIDIVDIPIVEITDQFLAYLDLMREVDIDTSSEYMVMAATLIYIKSRSLLPQHEEEVEELREELVERLLEHEQYRAAAAALGNREEKESRYWRRPGSLAGLYMESEEEPLLDADLFDLITAFQHVLVSLGADPTIQVGTRQYAVEDKMAEIEEMMRTHAKLSFATLASRYKIRRELIAVFLAILELIRRRKIRALQSAAFGEIILVKPSKNKVDKGSKKQ